MNRFSIETTRTAIESLRDQDPVYKVQVDELKFLFNRSFETEWRAIIDQKYLSLPQEERSEADALLYFDAPYTTAHWYGKKFSKTLDELPSSDFKDAAVSHRNRWRPLFIAFKELQARQVKGRIPVKKEVVATRIQHRATCPCCFRQQAVKGDRMVAHGYTLDYGFQNGNCIGHGKPHFGTVEGVQFTQDLIRNVRSTAASLRLKAEGAAKGEIKPIDRKTRKTIETPTDAQVRTLVANLESEARHNEYHAEQMQKMVDGWKFADPVEVEVEVTA